MAAQYTHQQIIFALSSIANTPSGRHGSVAELESYATDVIGRVFANTAIIDLIGRWELVWGPAVFQAPKSTVADNAMYVAHSLDDPSQFVVAISGTNPISAYGWIVEDFTINPTLAWPYSSASDRGDITHGTSIGLNVLLNTLHDNKLSLSQYLASQVSSCASALNITVTGHSLGGALSPSTALALLDTQGIPIDQPNGWDPDSSATIAVLPSAGPTPGNKTWRDYYDHKLGSNTDRIWNKIDIVPHAWQLSMLEEIPTIYAPTIPENKLISALVDLAKINSIAAGNLQQINPSVAGFAGTINTSKEISIHDIIEILETLLANKIIDKIAEKLDLSSTLIALIKAVIDDLIKHLNNNANANILKASSLSLKALESKGINDLKAESHDLFDSLMSFIDFLIQAGYQHTTAYSDYLGTQAYEDIVSAIKTQVSSA